jgi:hypothetical protein
VDCHLCVAELALLCGKGMRSVRSVRARALLYGLARNEQAGFRFSAVTCRGYRCVMVAVFDRWETDRMRKC